MGTSERVKGYYGVDCTSLDCAVLLLTTLPDVRGISDPTEEMKVI
jgi:hypothetical protein